MAAGRTENGTYLRGPLNIYTDAKKTSVQVIDASGNVTGGVAPTSITADTLVTTTHKIEFYAAANYINAPSSGKIAIVATAGGADDIQLTGTGINITGTLAVSGATALASTLSAGNTTITGTASVSGAVTLSSTVATGALTVTGAATISTTLGVTGAATFSSTVATGALTVTGAATVSTTLGVSGLLTASASVAVTGKVTATTGIQARAVAVTATTDGLTTGIIPVDCSVVTVTSSVNTKLVTLPTPTPGVVVWINAEATGYGLRSDTPASVAINGGTGAAVKSAVSAKTLRCYCSSATTWVVTAFGADGTVSALAAAS